MEVLLSRDWPTLVRVEGTALGNVLDRNGPDEVAADKCVEPLTEMSDIILDGCVVDDCVLPEGVLRVCELLGSEVDKGIFDEDMLGNCALDECLSDRDRPDASVLDAGILREAWLDGTLLGNPPVVTD